MDNRTLDIPRAMLCIGRVVQSDEQLAAATRESKAFPLFVRTIEGFQAAVQCQTGLHRPVQGPESYPGRAVNQFCANVRGYFSDAAKYRDRLIDDGMHPAKLGRAVGSVCRHLYNELKPTTGDNLRARWKDAQPLDRTHRSNALSAPKQKLLAPAPTTPSGETPAAETQSGEMHGNVKPSLGRAARQALLGLMGTGQSGAAPPRIQMPSIGLTFPT